MMDYMRLGAEHATELDAICAMERRLYGAHALASIDFFAQLVDPCLGSSGIVVCGKDGERVVSYNVATKGDSGDVCFIADLVEPDMRGHGIGLATKRRLVSACLDDGFAHATATIAPENVANVALYCNKLGMQAVGYARDKYGAGEHRLYFRGALDNQPPVAAVRPGDFTVPMDAGYDYRTIDFARYAGVAVINNELLCRPR